MEQKRVLWIVAAVGLFLLVTIGTALIVYRPSHNQTPVLNPQLGSAAWTRENPAPAATQDAATATPAEPAQPATAVPAGEAQITNLTVISANTNVISDGTKTIDLNALTRNAQAEPQIPADTAPAQPLAAVASAEITVNTVTTPAAVATATVQQTTTTAQETPVEKTVTSTPTKTTKPAASSVKTVTAKVPDQFWVQAASFTKKVNAEEARDALAAEKIPGEVFTWKDANGVVYYRLRVGPYTTKSEADYWLSRIKEISAFASTSSYVVNSSEKAAN